MILEGLVTTTGPGGGMHVAAMGPHLDEGDIDRGSAGIRRLTLKPFLSSATHANLARHGEGVFHLTDDVLLLADVVTGSLASSPASRAAEQVAGFVLEEACMAYEFRVVSVRADGPRGACEAEVVATHAMRPFLGFNRAAAAVVEGAILVSRIGILPMEEIRRQMELLSVVVAKTAGERERQAFGRLEARIAREP
jgi:hypothetical protein